jgi:hypothetical protein
VVDFGGFSLLSVHVPSCHIAKASSVIKNYYFLVHNSGCLGGKYVLTLGTRFGSRAVIFRPFKMLKIRIGFPLHRLVLRD